jgi:hypothetical protein
MAYGALLQGEGHNIAGDFYRVTIYEDGFGGSLITGTLAVPLFNLTYQPVVDDISSSLCPSVLDFFFIQNSTAIEDIVSDIITYQQSNQYLVLVERNSGSGYYDYWRGIILQDQIEVVDQSSPTIIKFTAIDGLAYLQSVPYNFANTENTTEPHHTKVRDIIKNALQAGISTDFWDAGDKYLVTSVNWWENSQTYGPLVDPLDTQLFDARAYVKVISREDGFASLEYKTCFDVLNELARVYLARIYMANGHYVFEQIPSRASQNVKQIYYNKAGTQLTASIPNLGQAVGQTIDAARLAKNNFIYRPALKEVSIEMDAYGSNFDNLITLTGSNYTSSTVQEYGYFDQSINNIIAIGAVNQSLIINVDFKTRIEWEYLSSDIVVYGPSAAKGYVGLRPVFRCKIELNDFNSATNYWWNDNTGLWGTSAVTFDVLGADKIDYVIALNSGKISYRPADNVTQRIQTTDLPATGSITVTIDNYRFEKLTGLPGTFSTLSYTVGGSNPTNLGGQVEFSLNTYFGRGNTIRLFSIQNSDTKIADNQIFDYGKINIRDGSLQTGNIIIEPTSGNFAACTDWRIANGSQDIALGALLVKQRLEIQKEVIEEYTGNVLSSLGYMYGLVFESSIWIAQDYSLDAYSNQVSATWTKIGVVTEGSSTVGERNPSLNNLAAGSNGSFKMGGTNRMGGLLYGPNLLGGLVQDDDENLLAVSQPYLMTKGQRNNYIIIDAAAGGSGSAAIDSTVVLFNWAGADGTYAYEIPDADDMDGAVLEIVLSDGFGSGRNITITPASGNIQGASSITVTTASSRQLLRAMNGNWY